MKIITARIQSILKRFPDVERIFEWYEIELTEETKLLRLEERTVKIFQFLMHR